MYLSDDMTQDELLEAAEEQRALVTPHTPTYSRPSGSVYSAAHNGYVTACAYPHPRQRPATHYTDRMPACAEH